MINLNAFFLWLGKKLEYNSKRKYMNKNGSAVPKAGAFIWIWKL
jgi:hypothetical protein